MGSHAIYAPSSAARWGSADGCPGSVHASRDAADYGSVAASRGTRLHALCEAMLRDHTYAPQQFGPPGCDADEERADRDSVLQFVRYVERLQDEPGAVALYESKSWFIEPLCGGTSDAVVFAPKVLTVVDYKAGYQPVEVKDNLQLSIYALGVIRKFADLWDFKRVNLVIVQPQAFDEPQVFRTTTTKLERLGKILAERIEKIENGDRTLVPSKRNCQFCRAKPTCPALQSRVSAVAKAEFANVVPSLSWEERMELASVVITWANSVKDELLAKLVAGEQVDGFKLVAGRGSRVWRDEEETVEYLAAGGLLASDYREPARLKTPAQIEKMITGAGSTARKKSLAKFIARTDGAPTVAPDSDSRPAIDRQAEAKREFANLTEKG